MNLKELLIKIGFKTEGQDQLKGIQSSLDGINRTLGFMASVQIVKGLFDVAEKFASLAQDIHLAATSAGLTVEAFQSLSFAAKQSGVSQDTMSTALARLSRHLYDARMGSEESIETFAELGFTQQQVLGFRTASDALLAMSDKFNKLHDAVAKQAFLTKLAGRGAFEMVEFLNKGSAAIQALRKESEKLGVVLSTKQINALVDTQHALLKVQGVFQAFFMSMASEFAPSIKRAIDDFLKFWEVNKKLINLEMKKWIYDVGFAMGFIYEIIKIVVQKFLDWAKVHPILARRLGELILVVGILATAALTLGSAIKIVVFALSGLGPVLSVASEALAVFVGIITEPVTLAVAAIGSLVVILHDAWKLLTGGKLEDTWIGQFFGWISSFRLVREALEWLSNFASNNAIIQWFESFANIFSKAGVAKALDALGSFYAKASSLVVGGPAVENVVNSAVGAGGNQNNSSASVTSNVTINVPSGTDPQAVHQSVKDGIAEHLGQVYRQTQTALSPARIQ